MNDPLKKDNGNLKDSGRLAGSDQIEAELRKSNAMKKRKSDAFKGAMSDKKLISQSLAQSNHESLNQLQFKQQQLKSSSIPTMEFRLELVSKEDSNEKDFITSFASQNFQLKPQFSGKAPMQKTNADLSQV